MKAEHDKHAKDLPTLEVGQAVALQNPLTLRWGDETGIVQSIRNSGRTYIVILDADNGIKTRNRRFLRPVKVDPEAEAMEHIPDEEDTPAAPVAPATSKKTKKKKQDQQAAPSLLDVLLEIKIVQYVIGTTTDNSFINQAIIMGASESKDKITSSAIDRSSGFHIFELHMPTAGVGIGAIVLIPLVLMMLNFCRKYLSSESKSSRASANHHPCLERQPAIQMQPYPMPMMMPPGHFPMSSLPTICEQGPRPKPLQYSTRFQELPVDEVAFAPPRQSGEDANSRDSHLYSPLPRSSPYSGAC
jgi:hypothetical protein